MADSDITNLVLLQHMQAMKSELRTEMQDFRKEVSSSFTDVYQRLEDAHKHREALQEDLHETMRVQGKHARKLKVLAKSR